MKHLSILLPDDQTNLSTIACIIGACQMFSEANAWAERCGKSARFNIELVSAAQNKALHTALLSIKADVNINEINKTDLVIIPASLIRSYEMAGENNRRLIQWIKQQYKKGAAVASICAGAFTLAATGLLAGRNCSTHWALSDDFRFAFPDVNMQADRLITDEQGIYTNGGAYSFLHLLVYLVEKYYDRETAIHCAKYFQVDLDRNMQSEFSIFNGYKKHDDAEILQAQLYIERHYKSRISIELLSEKCGLGRRNFDRRFIKATSLTPLDYLQRVKIEAAKKSFENTRHNVAEVMYEVGYNDTKSFREVFSRVTGMSPVEYKAKYNKSA